MPSPRLRQSPSAKPVIPDSEQCNSDHPGPQLSRSKCTPYFSTLIKARWGSFGRPSSTDGSPCDFLSFLATLESDRVYKLLHSRQCMMFMAREYTRVQQEELSKGKSLEESRARTFQRLKCEETEGKMSQVDAHAFADAITEALRWQSLVDAVGVPEIFLLDYYDEDTDIWGDIPLPDIASVSDKEWPSLFRTLLSPTLGLKETCLRLSGVVDMIERLRAEELESRKGLVRNIEQRIEHVLGTWTDLPGCFDEDDDDYSMTDSD